MSIEVRNITKSFGSSVALRDVSLIVPSGMLVALLGPSGSGKTTLLRIIAGLEQPDRGSGPILFHDEDVGGKLAGERRVGFVFQHYALFRHMTVFENIAFGLRVRPRSQRPPREEIEERVHKLLKLIQLENMAHRFPNQLSGGQRQRVALARALAVEPSVLLLDEPFGALDAKVRKELRDWLRRLHDEIHVTSVFVTHDQDEAMELSDRVVVMNEGRIEQVGTPDEVFHRPATEFVMYFLGQVNLFHGRVEDGRFRADGIEVQTQETAGMEGQKARLYVRPHDLEVAAQQQRSDMVRALIVRIQSAGPTVRLELEAQPGRTIHAELSHERFAELSVGVGAEVFVSPRIARVFIENDRADRRGPGGPAETRPGVQA